MPDRTYPVLLPAGRALQMHAAPGAQLVCLDGRLLIHSSPQWMGEQMVAQDLTLCEGEVMPIGADGWLRIEARQQSAFALLAAPPGALRMVLAAAMRRLRGGKRRMRAGQAA